MLTPRGGRPEWVRNTIHLADRTDRLATIAGNAGMAHIGRPWIDGVDSCIGVPGIAGARRDGDAALEILRERIVEDLSAARARQCRGGKQSDGERCGVHGAAFHVAAFM